jgi:hypothetical protein
MEKVVNFENHLSKWYCGLHTIMAILSTRKLRLREIKSFGDTKIG